jgi:ArsR family transcriptional regulator
MARVNGVFEALADPTRLRIIAAMETKAVRVTDLVDLLGVGQSRISFHLKQLRKARIILQEREGREIYYWISPAAFWDAVRFLELFPGEPLRHRAR